jgi:hypothetical protein
MHFSTIRFVHDLSIVVKLNADQLVLCSNYDLLQVIDMYVGDVMLWPSK